MLKRTGFARKTYTPAPAAPLRRVERAGVLANCADMGIPMSKSVALPRGALEQIHKDKLVELGCMCCRMALNVRTPDVELHHLRAGQGWGKGDWLTLIPLCHEHHRGDSGVHGLGTKRFPREYGFTEQDMLDKALQLLGITRTDHLNASPVGEHP